jgi:uncharacterized surface protein with fasciclin (FAS1) repeats
MTRSWTHLVAVAGLALTGLALPGCSPDATDGNAASANKAGHEGGEAASPIGAALAESPDHARFLEALRGAGLVETLDGAGPYTVFAPTNAAFDALPTDSRPTGAALIALLSGHIVSGTVTAADLRSAVDRGTGNRAELATVGGGTLTVTRDGETLVLTDGAGGQARIAGSERIQSNGVMHGIDAVLRPAAAD